MTRSATISRTDRTFRLTDYAPSKDVTRAMTANQAHGDSLKRGIATLRSVTGLRNQGGIPWADLDCGHRKCISRGDMGRVLAMGKGNATLACYRCADPV